jgi:arylformamidase
VDAPLHLDPSGTAVDQLPVEHFLGPAEVVGVRADGTRAGLSSLPKGWTPRAPRVLVRTDSHQLGHSIEPGFTGLSPEVVVFLAEHGVRLVGIDTPSVDAFDDQDLLAHRQLMATGLVWIEGLWLADAAPGLYLMVALPMALAGTEAAPVRILLRAEDDREENHP